MHTNIASNDPLFSIVIAVYNNEKYVSIAIESVLSQDFNDYEIIIVDDGSTDNTSNIVDSYARNYLNIRVIHQSNQWIYASFNNGVLESRGRYVYILNSDDLLLPNALETLYKLLVKYNYPDVIWTRVIACKCDDEQNVLSQHLLGSDGVVEKYYSSREQVHKSWLYIYKNDFSVNQANLYSRELMLHHPFRNDVYGADTLFNISIAEEIQTCVVCPKPIYRFNMYTSQRNTSIGKYYEYEHMMFSDFYVGHRDLLRKWGCWNKKAQQFFAERRIRQFIGELRSMTFSSCTLTREEKIRRTFSEYKDDIIDECSQILDKEEEVESRIIFFLREMIGDKISNETMELKDAIVRDFLDYSSLKKQTMKSLQHKVRRMVYNTQNPCHIGKIFYNEYIKGFSQKNHEKKKVIWLCNVVIPEFAAGYGMRKVYAGSWISGMLSEVEKKDDVEVAFVFPIFNSNRMRDGFSNGHRFFSFHFENTDQYTISENRIERMEEILEDYCPDIVHIWGTEYPWTLEMLHACKKRNLLDHMVVYIQGLTSICARSYQAGIPEPFYSRKINNERSIKEFAEEFVMKGKNEVTVLQNAKHVIGRTEWDHGIINAVNNKLKYYYVREILRNSFYDNIGGWSYDNCDKHKIFVSQAAYPIKGFHHLIQALPIVLDVYPDTCVIVAGDDITTDRLNPYSLYVLELIEKNGVNESVFFLGRLSEDEMIQHYISANVFVSASSIENSSNSVCEAMMVGTPIVASFVGGISSFLEHGISGFLYPENEIELMAFYIILLFSNPLLCGELSKSAIKKAMIINSRNDGYNDLLKCYSRIIDHNVR